ncbi:TorD/DmsD family molecular chaperone, partial [Slackia piriformis]
DRAHTYGMLARLFRIEVDQETLRELQGMRFPTATGSAAVDDGYRMLFNYLKTAWEDSITELAIDYVRTFIGHGVNGYSAAYPFESVYTSERRLLMQEARAEVLATLRENNLKRGSWNEGEDHIALELEFMQRLSMRCADALAACDEDEAIRQLSVQHTFMKDHLMNWIPMFVMDMLKFSKTGFYRGLGTLLWGYVEFDESIVSELLEGAQEDAA